MNKRFSTLLAAALVAGGVSASAQRKAVDPATDLLNTVKSGDYVSLNVGSSAFTSFTEDNGLDFSTLTDLTAGDAFDAFSGMWKITIIPFETPAGMPTYSFENKLTGKQFAVKLQTNGKDGVSTTAAAYDEDGETEWGFNGTLGLYHVEGDSTFFFGATQNLVAVKGGLAEALASVNKAVAATNMIIPTLLADDLELTLTPKIFNQLTTSGRLFFNNGKDVKNPSVENFLGTKVWKAASAAIGGGEDATSFMLATTDSTDIKSPKVLVVDTTYFDLAKTLNRLIVDTLGAAPKHVDGVFPAAYVNKEYKDEVKEGKIVKRIALRPYESAVFTGYYYLLQDSIVLYASNKPESTNVPEKVASAGGYMLGSTPVADFDALKSEAKTESAGKVNQVVTTATATVDGWSAPTAGGSETVTVLGVTYTVTEDGGNYNLQGGTLSGSEAAFSDAQAAVNNAINTLATSTKNIFEAEIEKWTPKTSTYDAIVAGISVSGSYADAQAAVPAYNAITTTAITGQGTDRKPLGQIALKYLDVNKIVITPSFGDDICDEAKATAKDFIHPLIQPDFNNEGDDDNRATVNDNLYTIKNKDGKYLGVAIHYADSVANWTSIYSDFQVLDHMPAFQWVVLQDRQGKDNSKITLVNREYPTVKNTKSVQLFEDEDGKLYGDLFGTKVYVEFNEVSATAKSDTLLGYRNFDKDSLKVVTYTFNHFSPYDASHFIGVNSESDSVLTVKDYQSSFKLEQINGKDGKAVRYGYAVSESVAKRIPGLKNLYRNAYAVVVRDGSANNGKRVFRNEDDKFAVEEADKATVHFYFKENNCDETGHYYALIALAEDTMKAGVAEETKKAILRAEEMANINTSVFAIKLYDAPLYRRFNTELEGVKDGKDIALNLKFKEFYRGEYLMDENNENFQDKSVDYLGIWSENKATGLSFHVDTAWVKRGLGYIKPQYLISVDRHVVDAVPAKPCDLDHEHLNGITEWTCPHAEKGKAGYTVAKFLVNFKDSADAVTRRDPKAENPYKFGKYYRAGFEKAMLIGDSLIFLVNGFENVAPEKLDSAKIIDAYKEAEIDGEYIKDLSKINDAHQTYTWSFRYIHPESVATAEKEDENVSFLIESMIAAGNNDKIAPTNAAWLKSQDGCLVLSTYDASFIDAKTGSDAALIFNIGMGSEDDWATDNETIATSEIAVIAGEGQVTIANAAGKKVVVSNILGQVVANTVLASDNAVIAAPAGVVVVAVEGEEAVKAIVK